MRSLAVAFCALLLLPASASASEMIDRNARNVKLGVDRNGQALVTYNKAGGRAMHVRVWGAIDARQPTTSRPQVRFRKDYSGRYWTSFRNQCRAYDGPKLAFQVAACAAPDGSYWALQSWRRTLPNFDGSHSGLGTWELHLSHWSGAIATMDSWTDWVYGGRFHHLFGRLTYDGKPVYGFSATRVGSPLDGYGRNIYVDTFDSRYGKGWRRENAFLAHQPTGVFCYGFYKFSSRGPGNGTKYRLTAIGPGVTPDVSTTVSGLHDFNANSSEDVAYEQRQNALQDTVAGADKKCHVH